MLSLVRVLQKSWRVTSEGERSGGGEGGGGGGGGGGGRVGRGGLSCPFLKMEEMFPDFVKKVH